MTTRGAELLFVYALALAGCLAAWWGLWRLVTAVV